MYIERVIKALPMHMGDDGIKIYSIALNDSAVDFTRYQPELERLKSALPIVWTDTAAFAIFHQGQSMLYLILAYWGNDNELFTTVSVLTHAGWLVDHSQYSFCLWDMQVMWFERNSFIRHLYNSHETNINAYRSDFYQGEKPLS